MNTKNIPSKKWNHRTKEAQVRSASFVFYAIYNSTKKNYLLVDTIIICYRNKYKCK